MPRRFQETIQGNAAFRPLPLLRNPHAQTVVSAFWPGGRFPYASTEHQVELPDGDRLLLHESTPSRWQAGKPIAVLVHGLAGCHQSGHVRRQAALLVAGGWRVVRLDLRGCGRGIGLARRSYHAGCSEDVRAVLLDVRRRFLHSPLVLIGFSLGGNIILKLAGEAGSRPIDGLCQVVAVAPPVDLAYCSQLLAQPRNRFYEVYFLRRLVALVRQRERCFPDAAPVRFPRHLTLRRFDDLYTAPRSGFVDAADYYGRAAALPHIPAIRVPTLILTARDDPFVAVKPIEDLAVPSNVEVCILPHGGHLGFLGWDGAGGIRWAERKLAQWLLHGLMS